MDGDSLAVQGGEGQEDGERDEEADQGEREEDHRHLVNVEVESDVRKVNARRVVCPAPTARFHRHRQKNCQYKRNFGKI